MNKTIDALKLAEEALDLAQALLEKSYHHATILNAYKETRKYREALAEQEKQEPVAAMKKPNVEVITADVRAALCFALWHHQGGSSSIGQLIREILGPGQHDHMTSEQYFAAKRVAEALHAAPVSAKAIRAEALEEAAKVCEQGTAYIQFQSNDCYSCAHNRAAAIRGMK